MAFKDKVRGAFCLIACLTAFYSCAASYRNPASVLVYSADDHKDTPLKSVKAHFVSGEEFSYELSLRGVVGGEAHTQVGKVGEVDGRPSVVFHSTVETVGLAAFFKEVRDDVTTWLDATTGRPFGLAADVKFGSKEASIETNFLQGPDHSFQIAVRKPGAKQIKVRQHVPEGYDVDDIHSLMSLVRGWEPKDNERATLYLLSGRRLWRNRIQVSERENIKTKLGKFKAVRVDGVAQRVSPRLREVPKKGPRFYSVWMTDDSKRLPLLILARTEYGDVRLELTDYFRPDDAI